MMKDSKLDPNWLRQMMQANPPSIRENGNIFSGLVRLSYPNVFQRGKPPQGKTEGKYGATLLFPLNADLSLFNQVWFEWARKFFPDYLDPQGNPVGLHSPFHDQREKAFGSKPQAGYTPGALYLACSSDYQPLVVDTQGNLIVDEKRVYPGVWAFAGLNVYKYGLNPPQPKKGIGFGLQTLMIVADDVRIAGGGGGDPKKDFANVQISAQSNIAAKFDALPGMAQPQTPSIMTNQGHVGTVGGLPVQPLPGGDDLSDMM